jgi:hypothetical protein
MLIVSGSIVIIIALLAAFEYRLRQPDQMVLYEVNGKIKFNKGKFYKRHFSLALPQTAHSTQLNVEASAKGNIDIKVKLAVTVAASAENIHALIRAGGWNQTAVVKASKELETIIHALVKEFTEKYEIEELSSEKIFGYLQSKTVISKEKLGLEIISLTVQSFDASDAKIAEAMRQQESARIMEHTEMLNQKARINAAKAKLKADEEIASMENELALKKFELKETEFDKESALALKRAEEELKRKKMGLEFDKQELEMLKNNPELLMLSPQAARLAEASQSLKNARTVVSLSPGDTAQGTDLLGMFQSLIQKAAGSLSKKSNEK